MRWIILSILALCFIATASVWITLEVINRRIMKTQDSFPPLKSRQTITFRVDHSFSQEEQKSILKAMKAWEIATDGLVQFQTYIAKPRLSEFLSGLEHFDPMIYDARKPSHWVFYIARYIMNPPTPRAMVLLPAGDIFIMFSRGDRDFQSSMEHELGHVLIGGWHSPNKESIMYPRASDKISQHITDANALLARNTILASRGIKNRK